MKEKVENLFYSLILEGMIYVVAQDREKMHEIFRLVSIFFKEIGNVRLQGDGRAH